MTVSFTGEWVNRFVPSGKFSLTEREKHISQLLAETLQELCGRHQLHDVTFRREDEQIIKNLLELLVLHFNLRRYAQDSESGDMLDIIYSTKSFDIGHNCNWNNIIGLGRTQMEGGRIPKLSGFNKVKPAVVKAIEEDYLDYLNIGKDVPVEEPAE